MSLLSERSIVKEDKSNIITLGAIAKEEKKKDPTVTNATIGMLYTEDAKLFTFNSVDKALMMLSADEKYAYASTPGAPAFHTALKKWVFREDYDVFKNKSAVMATPGGSGALSNTFANYANENDKILLPSYMWGNYKQIAYENHQSFETYNLFNAEGGFDLTDVKAKMTKLKAEQGRVLIVVNDPCQNPTGYVMSDSEWDGLIAIINELSEDGTPVVLLHDMAYIDYDSRGFEATRNNVKKYLKLNKSALVVMAFSGSKTFALYGVRIGAQVAISNDPEAIKDFERANKFSSRAKWSNTTQLGASLITKIIDTPELKASFEKELEDSRNLLALRAKTFLDESKKAGLVTLPFACGFFITIPADNAEKAYEYLTKKKVHVIPMGKVLRVTISAISVEECKKLPAMIKEAIDQTK